MKDVARGRRDHDSVHDHESASTPGRTTNVPDRAGASGSGAPYTTATMTGERPPWSSDRPEAAPPVDLTPKLSSGLAPAPAVAPQGPGLAEVKNLYAPYAPGDGVRDPGLMADVARIVEKHPDEEAAIRAYIETRDGADARHALVAALEENKRKKNGVRLEGAALDLGNPLLPRVGVPVWAGGVSRERDNPEEARIAQSKRQDVRDAERRKEKTPNPMVEGLNRMRTGPEPESKEVSRNGQKLIDALEDERKRKAQRDGGTPDAGSPLEIRKGLDD
ncbi:MAG: hypothetical protein HOV81_06670 [Kofleriaceae bacterium]|nr:hypothetical protein [Kofleriaceae bacterium]